MENRLLGINLKVENLVAKSVNENEQGSKRCRANSFKGDPPQRRMGTLDLITVHQQLRSSFNHHAHLWSISVYQVSDASKNGELLTRLSIIMKRPCRAEDVTNRRTLIPPVELFMGPEKRQREPTEAITDIRLDKCSHTRQKGPVPIRFTPKRFIRATPEELICRVHESHLLTRGIKSLPRSTSGHSIVSTSISVYYSEQEDQMRSTILAIGIIYVFWKTSLLLLIHKHVHVHAYTVDVQTIQRHISAVHVLRAEASGPRCSALTLGRPMATTRSYLQAQVTLNFETRTQVTDLLKLLIASFLLPNSSNLQ
ncbi:unnamed protein product [Nesidiocoris tenuis]|uniref:Uncharacterized protein n=1 Tax=Nesidiocoris tenuis TaxID=355587 RepID=A0A6H5GA50_9HEMI|nr:unnamed protein product [Nesidiocoris tenuis]